MLSDSPVWPTVNVLEGGISTPAKTKAPIDVSSSMIAPVAAHGRLELGRVHGLHGRLLVGVVRNRL